MTLIIALGGSALAIVLYITVDPSFSIFNNFISDLSIGPNGSNIIFILFNLGMAISVQPFFLYLSRYLISQGADDDLAIITYGASILFSISQILLVFFPLDTSNQSVADIHMVFAVLFFVFVSITMLLYAYLEFTLDVIPKYLPLLALITGILGSTFSFFLFLGTYTEIFDYNIITYLTEWSTFSVFSLWLLLQCIYLYKNPNHET